MAHPSKVVKLHQVVGNFSPQAKYFIQCQNLGIISQVVMVYASNPTLGEAEVGRPL